ncbi:U2 small nuclear ribonucleo protein B [Bimuria novae-zelandiae CBS 107.79]|uniref:U2 small nuclear ribonucleo protein B n=1 Tax=Bimuria novae-zelandiae CBS 107.79 TaxID=1447943 RepID=A0A6A5UM69_9PLEO|nr:U2 small nuclear ribonucleo protein B [Bimuria novae-zelandiae CBS 107.79]
MGDKMEGVVSGGGAIDPKYGVPIETCINNLCERQNVEHLKTAVRRIFQHYGEVIDVIAKSSLRRKGQAFVVFDSEKSGLGAVDKAIDQMNGFEVFGKPMRVERARTPSDATVKRLAPEKFEEHKRKRLMLKERKQAEEDAKAQANPAAAAEKPRAKPGAAAMIPDEFVRPNKTLFVQSIPYEIEESDLTAIFERFEGFKEVRYVKLRAVAFVEFENEQYSITAKEQTADVRVGKDQKQLKISYQRA